MKNWLEKWLIPTALVLLLIYSIFVYCEIDRALKDCKERLATTEPATEAETPERAEPAAEPETEAPEVQETSPEPETEAEPTVETEPQHLGTFKLTAYCACPKCCGEWADGITYTGTKATAGRTVAVDPRVIPLGSSVYINGQEYIAEDTGGAIKGNRIDIFFPSHAAALEFGVQYSEVTIN